MFCGVVVDRLRRSSLCGNSRTAQYVIGLGLVAALSSAMFNDRSRAARAREGCACWASLGQSWWLLVLLRLELESASHRFGPARRAAARRASCPGKHADAGHAPFAHVGPQRRLRRKRIGRGLLAKSHQSLWTLPHGGVRVTPAAITAVTPGRAAEARPDGADHAGRAGPARRRNARPQPRGLPAPAQGPRLQRHLPQQRRARSATPRSRRRSARRART